VNASHSGKKVARRLQALIFYTLTTRQGSSATQKSRLMITASQPPESNPSIESSVSVRSQMESRIFSRAWTIKKKFERKTRRNKTLIFEMQNTMIKVLDPFIDEFNLMD
jgi:hypothetical protein